MSPRDLTSRLMRAFREPASLVRRRVLSLPGLALAMLLPWLVQCTASPTDSAPAVETITLTPPTVSVREGSSVTLSARATTVDGQPATGQTIFWSSSTPSVATVSRTGVVTALSAGETRVAASAGGRSATVPITVTPRTVATVLLTPAALSLQVGGFTTLAARTVDADGAELVGRTVTWTSSNSAVASVNAQGRVAGVAAGAATITATSEGRTAQSAVTITLAPVAAVTIAPARDTIAVGGTRQLVPTLRDAGGAVLSGRTITWSSSSLAIATVSSSGQVLGLAPGTVTITGASEGRSGTAVVVVLARLASTVILSPASGTLVVGATQSLTAQVTDAQGNILSDRPVTYTSDATAVATVSTTGVVTARAPGVARISAVSEGRTGSATFTVIPVPVAALQLTPGTASLSIGGTAQLTAVARSAAGAALTGRAITWISGAPSIASVSTTGLVTAVANGVALVLAVVDGVTASATITVAPPPVAAISVVPLDPSITIGGTVQLTATLRTTTGTVLTGRTVAWSTADESIAFVSSTGQVVGLRAGTVRITATSEGVSASTLVTVR
jgi:trimeric autotransporter adhesin